MTAPKTPARIDMDQALLDPGSVFADPGDVLTHDTLTKQQKVEVLRRWEYDASEASVALEEGMPGDENDLLRRILLALDQLLDGVDVEHVAPSKQHGISGSGTKSK